MDLTRLTGSISGPAVFLCLLSLFFAGCKKTEQAPHETPTIIYEHPVTMDIPVTGSWVGHLDGVDNEGSGDGEAEKDDFVRSNTDDLGSTGNGVLTKVYLDTDKELITLVSINTWLAQATTDYSEANEYATLRVYTGVTGASNSVTTANYNVDVEDVPAVADVTDGTFYQVNISFKDVLLFHQEE